MKRIIAAVVLMIFILLGGCAPKSPSVQPDGSGHTGSSTGMGAQTTGSPSPPATVEPTEKPDPIRQKLDGMTLDEKIGQMLIFGFDGKTLDTQARAQIARYKPGGLIIFGENIESAKQLLDLVNSIKTESVMHDPVPPFISVDEEGGRVSRMPPELKKFPPNLTIGKADDEGLSYRIGSVIAEEIKAFGFNMDFAPVLDIFSNPKNTVIGNRSFGRNPGIVGKLGVQTMKGLRSGGVIPVVKHFPGHGDTLVDSHVGLPIVEYGMDRLESFELLPFKEAVDNGAEAVMAAHILLPKLDPDYPASLSKAIITGLLREKMGFGGVVITDDMTMGAIVKNYGIADAAVKAVNAGADIILVAHDYDSEKAVADAIKSAAESGNISMERIDESVYRILRLKAGHDITEDSIGSVDIDKINKDISGILEKLG